MSFNQAAIPLPPSGHGRMLAVNEGFSFRPILAVQSFQFVNATAQTPQSTLIFGSQLMYEPIMEDRSGFRMFIKALYNQPTLYTQMRPRLHETLEEFNYEWRMMATVLAVVPTAQAELTMINGGYDPIRGYWLQFAGHVPFFDLPDWWVDRPEYEVW
jgi:hypothetical protein